MRVIEVDVVAQERAAEHIDWMNATGVYAAWRTDGFVILRGYLSEIELAPGNIGGRMA